MAKTAPSPFPFPPPRLYLGEKIPMRVIRRYARAIADEFHPDKIILFGSYAYGTPNDDSDVDLLVVMPGPRRCNEAVRIQYRLAAPFPMDLLVRTPEEVARHLEEGQSFMKTIMSQGKVLYEKSISRVGKKSRGRLRTRKASRPKQGT
jgi:predicted nucleotidyltransferase